MRNEATGQFEKRYSVEVGQRFGLLTIVEEKGFSKGARWALCNCDCGNDKLANIYLLVHGKTKSCGCFRKLICGQNHSTHRQSKSPEYQIWCGMVKRCENENTAAYKDYGGRGINICRRWRDSFEAFLEDMGHRPTNKHSIERIDVNGNYDPNNCKWIPLSEQGKNKRPRAICKHGHLLEGENVHFRPCGHRTCRTCQSQKSSQRYFARKSIGKQL